MITILVFGRTGQVTNELQRLAPVRSLGSARQILLTMSPVLQRSAPITPLLNIVAAYTVVDRVKAVKALATKIIGIDPNATVAESWRANR